MTVPRVLLQKAIVPGLDLKGVAAAADEVGAPSSRSGRCPALLRGPAERVDGLPKYTKLSLLLTWQTLMQLWYG